MLPGGYFLDKYNCRLYLAIVLLCFGILIAIIPVARNLVELIVISVVLGIFSGALDCGELPNTTRSPFLKIIENCFLLVKKISIYF